MGGGEGKIGRAHDKFVVEAVCVVLCLPHLNLCMQELFFEVGVFALLLVNSGGQGCVVWRSVTVSARRHSITRLLLLLLLLMMMIVVVLKQLLLVVVLLCLEMSHFSFVLLQQLRLSTCGACEWVCVSVPRLPPLPSLCALTCRASRRTRRRASRG